MVKQVEEQIVKTKCWPKRVVQLWLVLVLGGMPLNGWGEEQVRAGLGWQPTRVSSEGFTLGLALGDGRGDKRMRLYGTHHTASTVREFTYDGSWANTSNFTRPSLNEGALLLGDGRGDGGAHLYVGGAVTSGADTLELTWNGASWTDTSIGAAGQRLVLADLGDARGDGSPHLYFSTGSPPPNNVAYEYSFDGTEWTLAGIGSPLAGESGSSGIAVADGRNDAVLRLYVAIYQVLPGHFYVYEFSWNGAGWDASQVADIGSESVAGLSVGDARNDGVKRIYIVGQYYGVREFTYDGKAWVQTSDIALGTNFVAIGDGQNDGINRLYITHNSEPFQDFRVVEATFDGATWKTAEVGSQASAYFALVRVGDARGDGVKRVYASGGGGMHEFTHQ